MERVKFNKCLNLESKAWNIPIPALLSMGIFALLGMLLKGAIGLVVAGAVGFGLGRYLSYEYHKGNLQRWIYWHLPLSKIGGKKFPSSHQRHLN